MTLEDGNQIEAVAIPQSGRITFCVSSQVGCAFGCSFCATASMGKVRNLGSAEILVQILHLADASGLAPGAPFHVVFMGMGEPLDNFDAVLEAFDILTDAAGLGLSWRRVTLSTVGHLPGIRRLAARAHRPRPAVSLNAARDRLRDRLMPVNRRWRLAELREALAEFPTRPGERITCEYVLLAGENDSRDDHRRLADWTEGLPVRINLIPWNPCPGMPHRRSSNRSAEAFRDTLLARGLDVSIRFSKGSDVSAACGQLATATRRHHGRTAS